MSRTKNKLTAKGIQAKKAPGYYSDGGNLYLRVSPTLSKSWAFYYTKKGRRSEMGLGSIEDITLEQAREKAQNYKKLIANGIDPLTEKRQQAANRLLAEAKSMTFAQCADAFIQKHQHELKNKKHIQQWTNTLVQYA